MSKQFGPKVEDVETALALLAAAVAERGADFVYQKKYGNTGFCRYVAEQEPACMIGLALRIHGWTVLQLLHLDGYGSVHGAARYISKNAAVIDVLRRAQAVQDGGSNWQEALTEARILAQELGHVVAN